MAILSHGVDLVEVSRIERMLESSPFINHAILFGDRRHYLTAIVTLDREGIEEWAAAHGYDYDSWEALAKSPRMREHVQNVIDDVNAKRPNFEAVRKFAILDSDFTLEAGELTPTLKLKRATVEARYRHIVEDLYNVD